eukprot:6187981-Pleurochrysis_carterae.AAC.3
MLKHYRLLLASPQRPSKIGPFLLKKLSWVSVGFSLLEDDDRAEGAGFCFEWPSLPLEHKFGWASPFYAVTLPSEERAAAAIPVAAQSFAYAYPLASESRRAVLRVAEEVLGNNVALRATLASFVENGGFVYVDSEFEIVAVNAVAARTAERGLQFGKPISFANTKVMRRLLRRGNRITGVVHEVSDEALKTCVQCPVLPDLAFQPYPLLFSLFLPSPVFSFLTLLLRRSLATTFYP